MDKNKLSNPLKTVLMFCLFVLIMCLPLFITAPDDDLIQQTVEDIKKGS